MALPRAARAADKPVYFIYSGYETPELHPEFFEKCGFGPPPAYSAAEEEADARLIAGFDCDLVPPPAAILPSSGATRA